MPLWEYLVRRQRIRHNPKQRTTTMTDNYEKSAGRKAVAKAYELGIAKEFDKEYAFFRTLTQENLGLAKEILNKYPDRAALLKEAFAQITMDDIKWANNIIQAAWRATTRKEFDDTLSQIRQPKGGTENLTNVASPGSPPGKIEAVPGHAGDYGKPGYALE